MRVDEILGKINIDTHLEGCWNDGGIMDEIDWGLDVWGSRVILEEDRVDGFELVLDIFLWKDGVEAFWSLNANFEVFSIFKCFKRDLGIYIALDFSFSLDAWECISLMMDLGIHIFFGLTLLIVDLCSLFCASSFLAFTCHLDGT